MSLPSHSSSPHRRALLLAAWVVFASLSACGGGGAGTGAAPSPAPAPAPSPAPTFGASQLAVLIAEGDPVSEAIGLAYQKARGVPESQVLRLSLPRGVDEISAADFAALKTTLDARLPATVQATVLTWMRPSRVVGACSMGITSALALGYDARYCGVCAAPVAVPYYNSDTRQPWTDLRIRPSMMLGASTLAEAEQLIARGVAADASMLAAGAPTPQAWLVRSSDANRSVRHPDFQQLATSGLSGWDLNYVDNANGLGSDEVTGRSNVLLYLTSLTRASQAASNRYLPGAVADTLTSFGGKLPGAEGQMPITDWLQAGATASYGTVEEPCNYVDKFPRATVLAARYRRGETLIEAYWKSVQAPGQGLFVGEPLARPWSPPP